MGRGFSVKKCEKGERGNTVDRIPVSGARWAGGGGGSAGRTSKGVERKKQRERKRKSEPS